MRINQFKEYGHILEIPWFDMWIGSGYDKSDIYGKCFRLNNKDVSIMKIENSLYKEPK